MAAAFLNPVTPRLQPAPNRSFRTDKLRELAIVCQLPQRVTLSGTRAAALLQSRSKLFVLLLFRLIQVFFDHGIVQ